MTIHQEISQWLNTDLTKSIDRQTQQYWLTINVTAKDVALISWKYNARIPYQYSKVELKFQDIQNCQDKSLLAEHLNRALQTKGEFWGKFTSGVLSELEPQNNLR